MVPLGGNSWVTVKSKRGSEQVTDTGWTNWQSKETVFSVYIYITKKGLLKLSAVINVPKGNSKIKCSVNGKSKEVNAAGSGKEYTIGEWEITEAGYVRIDFQGVEKTGDAFAVMNELRISGSAVDEQIAYVKNNEGNYFYWGRRGPSVHLNYDLTDVKGDIEWFYNEITVPKGNDIIGSYFMANGFGEGYFGMQVNSTTERRILFSVWSPYKTDDPKQIPADKKIILVKKGTDVHAGEFGDEGSGGQSYLKYNWKAGKTYKFLVRARPVENNYTSYTAYFYAVEQKKWLLIASFNRPVTTTYLTRLHSFLENFEPSTGNITRMAWYQNQWVRTAKGEWKALSKIKFTGDATAQKGYRLDYRGGVQNGKFFLQNCGFFNKHTDMKTGFSYQPATHFPIIDILKLE